MNIVSWNIQWGLGCDGVSSLARIVQTIRAMADADAIDVICLQEVAINHPSLAGSKGEDQVALLAAAFPQHSVHFAAASDLADDANGRRLFGNLLLSRPKVLQVFRHSLPRPVDPADPVERDAPSMPRVALEAVLAVGTEDGGTGGLRVTTTHLEYYVRQQRLAQIHALRRIHHEGVQHSRTRPNLSDVDAPFRGPTRPLDSVYCGDFNCTPESAELQLLGQAFDDGTPGLCDAWSIAHPGQAHAHTVGLHGCPWPEHPYCCDYFFVSQSLQTRVRRVEVHQASHASDHQPILLELTKA